jgi:hypothetical protein
MNVFRAIGILALAGCLGSAAEAPGSSRVYESTVERAWPAVEGTLSDLGYRTIDDRHDDGGGILHASREDVGELTVSAFPFMEQTTLVSVEAPNGDRDVEEEVLGHLDARLRPPASRPPVPTGYRRTLPAPAISSTVTFLIRN